MRKAIVGLFGVALLGVLSGCTAVEALNAIATLLPVIQALVGGAS